MMGIVQCSVFTMISLMIQQSRCPAVTTEKCHMAVHEVPWEEKKEVVWNKVTCTKNVSQSRLTFYYVHAMKRHEFLPAERKRIVPQIDVLALVDTPAIRVGNVNWEHGD